MPRNIDLRDLIPPDDERDTITMKDGEVWFMPELGVREMGRLAVVEEELDVDSGFERLSAMVERVSKMIEAANPNKGPFDYDLTVEEFMAIISGMAGAESATQAVRDALAKEPDDGEPADHDDAMEEAAALGEAAGTRAEDDERPLASPKRSRKRSSRSATSGSGGRNGGKASAGRSSSRTSKKPSASSVK